MITRDRVMNCQDYGNQAKKDCAYFKCRTCCKIKGFHCPTHVKTTWVPAAKRRQRQQNLANLQQLPSSALGILGQTGTRSGDEKRTQHQRLEMKSNFPWEVNKAATFRCVKVSRMEDEEEEIAYQSAVNINGHIFKGLLYDQGPEPECSSLGWINPQQAAEHTACGSGSAVITTPNTSLATTIVYPTPINAAFLYLE